MSALKILIVEDNPADAQLLVRALKRAHFDFEWERIETEADFLARLHSGLDLILSDYEMPNFNGLRALELLKQQPGLDIPFVLVSGTIGEERAVEAIRLGADDYLLKDRIGRLGPAVARARREVELRKERRRLEAQFVEAQKMEVVGQLAGGVAHDFNNVLGVIMGYSDLLTQDLESQPRLRKFAEEIRHAAVRAAGLTQQLLIFSRKQTVQPVALDVNGVIEGMEQMLRRLIDENVEMTIRCGESVGPILADAGYVWQVVMNLAVNARDAMPDGGQLVIETRGVEADEDFLRLHPGMAAGPYVLLSVSDTGTGIPPEVKAHLFEAFFTTKAAGKGTGLGLVTCQTIVRQMGGHIEVDTEPGRGTTFRLYFPQIAGSARSEQPVRPQDPSLRGTETLLVVEDEPSLRHLAESLLTSRGYQVLTAPNGQDALRVAQEHGGAPIALVLTDVVMPRMGGRVMAEWLRTAHPSIKVLFTSGYAEDALDPHGAKDAAIDFLPKPYTTDSLLRKVREFLER